MDCSRLIIRGCFEAINKYRQRHNVHPFIYERELEESAQKWAKDLARIRKRCHSLYSGVYYGETIFIKQQAAQNLTGNEIAATWFYEGERYVYGAEEATEKNYNFTQLIWAASREFGMAIQFNEDNQAYIVAHYSPFGNIPKQFKFNVFPPCQYKIPLMHTLDEMNVIGLDQHNLCREHHGCPPLVLCHDLVASAQAWANRICAGLGHISYAQYCSISEAIAVKFDPLGFICSREVTTEWYRHGLGHDYINFFIGSYADLFTQIIWKSTREIGFGRASYRGYHYLVVHYRPPANDTDFAANVPRLKSNKSRDS